MNVDEILEQRHEEYGTFMDVARLSQNLKNTINHELKARSKVLAPDQAEALAMMCSKIARLVAGNADHLDGWKDLAGYPMLVADRLEGKSR